MIAFAHARARHLRKRRLGTRSTSRSRGRFIRDNWNVFPDSPSNCDYTPINATHVEWWIRRGQIYFAKIGVKDSFFAPTDEHEHGESLARAMIKRACFDLQYAQHLYSAPQIRNCCRNLFKWLSPISFWNILPPQFALTVMFSEFSGKLSSSHFKILVTIWAVLPKATGVYVLSLSKNKGPRNN